MERALRTFLSVVAAGLAAAVGCGGERSFVTVVCDELQVCVLEAGGRIDRKYCITELGTAFADLTESERDDAVEACADATSCDHLICILTETASRDEDMGEVVGDGDGDSVPIEPMHSGCSAGASCLSCTTDSECAATMEVCTSGACRKPCDDDTACPDSYCYLNSCADIPGAPCESALDCHGDDCLDFDSNLRPVPGYCGGAYCLLPEVRCKGGLICVEGECRKP